MIYHGDILKYIRETPETILNAAAGQVAAFEKMIKENGNFCFEQLILIGTGSSYNAAYAAMEYARKKYGLCIAAVYPSEFFGMAQSLDRIRTLVVGVSQQGTSTAVIEAVEYAVKCGLFTLALTGEKNTPLSVSADREILVPIGEEDAGATTKGYAGTVISLMVMSDILFGDNPSADSFRNNDTEHTDISGYADLAAGNIDWSRIHDLSAAMRGCLEETEKNSAVLSDKLAKTKELIIITPETLRCHLPEIVLKFSEMCRIAVRGFTTDEFVHGIYNSVTSASSFLFIYIGEQSLTEGRLVQYYTERRYEILQMPLPDLCAYSSLYIMPSIMRLCVMIASTKMIDINTPMDPEFHRIIGSKLESEQIILSGRKL